MMGGVWGVMTAVVVVAVVAAIAAESAAAVFDELRHHPLRRLPIFSGSTIVFIASVCKRTSAYALCAGSAHCTGYAYICDSAVLTIKLGQCGNTNQFSGVRTHGNAQSDRRGRSHPSCNGRL